MSLYGSSRRPLSTEEYLRVIFEEADRRKNRDHTPRTLQPDGSQTTEDWLREVVFGTERPESTATPDARATVAPASGISPTPAIAVPAGIASIAEAGLSPEEPSSPIPYGWGTTLFPGRDAQRSATAQSRAAAEQGTTRNAGGRTPVPQTLLTADAGKTLSDAGEIPHTMTARSVPPAGGISSLGLGTGNGMDKAMPSHAAVGVTPGGLLTAATEPRGGFHFGPKETPAPSQTRPAAKSPAGGLSMVTDGERSVRASEWADGTPKDLALRKRFAELSKDDPAIPLETKIAAMSTEERLVATFLISDEELANKPESQRKFLLLCGVSPEVVRNAFDPRVSDKDYRNSLKIDMLPTDMRQPTQAWIDAGTAWVDANPQKIRAFRAAWDGAATRGQQEQTLRAMFTETETALGIQGVKLRFGKTPSGEPLETIKSDSGIIIDPNHILFINSRSQEDVFCDMFGALVQELVHTRQIATVNKYAGQERMQLNTVWFADRGAAITNAKGKVYLAYPIEMQAHIIHNAIRDRVRKNLRH